MGQPGAGAGFVTGYADQTPGQAWGFGKTPSPIRICVTLDTALHLFGS